VKSVNEQASRCKFLSSCNFIGSRLKYFSWRLVRNVLKSFSLFQFWTDRQVSHLYLPFSLCCLITVLCLSVDSVENATKTK
jgi:hypothetical protein